MASDGAGRAAPPGATDGAGRADRLAARIARDGAACVWCGRAFGRLVRATTDHLVPRVRGGPSWLENEVAACGRCNRARGHRGAADWADECERVGWPVDRARLVRTLRELDEAIDRRGGQRRARAQIAAQLRRLDA
ncbi:hypothetical protein GCM10020369_81070 [Cryptosporangium minutisporangium]|uniref:HNH domain-containing protein n=1 Tax=Cryptosporangium minutisporangium TaxID=113569 RepID=A0ABP6TDC0_9ACTN